MKIRIDNVRMKESHMLKPGEKHILGVRNNGVATGTVEIMNYSIRTLYIRREED